MFIEAGFTLPPIHIHPSQAPRGEYCGLALCERELLNNYENFAYKNNVSSQEP